MAAFSAETLIFLTFIVSYNTSLSAMISTKCGYFADLMAGTIRPLNYCFGNAYSDGTEYAEMITCENNQIKWYRYESKDCSTSATDFTHIYGSYIKEYNCADPSVCDVVQVQDTACIGDANVIYSQSAWITNVCYQNYGTYYADYYMMVTCNANSYSINWYSGL